MIDEPNNPDGEAPPFTASYLGQAIILFLLFFVFIVLMLLSWGQISKDLENVYESILKRTIADWQFYIIAAVLFGLLLGWYFYLFPALTNKPREKFKENPVLCTLVTILSLFVLLALTSFLFDLYSIGSKDSAKEVVNTLLQAPTDWRFYVIVVALAGLWASWRFHLKTKLRKNLKFENEDPRRQGLTERDWQAYGGLRERALALRTRAGLTLGGVFALLFGGVYFIIFLLPHIELDKESTIREAKHLKTFEEKFGDELQAMVEGRYWLKTHDGGSDRSQSRVSLVAFRGLGRHGAPQAGIESIRPAAASGQMGLIANQDGSVVITADGGHTWKSKDLRLKARERIDTIKFNDEDKHVLVVSNKNSLFWVSMNSKGELSIEPMTNLPLKASEKIMDIITFRNSDKRVLVVGGEGSAFLLSANEKSRLPQSKSCPPFRTGEGIQITRLSYNDKHVLIAFLRGSAFLISVNERGVLSCKSTQLPPDVPIFGSSSVLSNHGKHIVVVDKRGLIYLLSKHSNGKLSSKSAKLELETGESIRTIRFSKEDKLVWVVGYKDSAFWLSMNQKGELSPKPINLSFKEGERIRTIRFIDDGKRVLVLGSLGSALLGSVNQKDELSYKPINLPFKAGERVRTIRFSNDGKRGLVIGYKDSAFWLSMNQKGELSHKLMNLPLKAGERIENTLLINNYKSVLIVGDTGSAFLLSVHEKGGLSPKQINLPLTERARIPTIGFSNDGKHGLLSSRKGPIFVTTDGGQTWKATIWDGRAPELAYLLSVPLGDGAHTAVAVGRSGSAYLLKEHPDMREWKKWELADIVKNKFLRDSQLFKEMGAFLAKGGSFGGNKRTDNADYIRPEKSKPSTSIFGATVDRITLIQITTMTVLFFLVQLLVRLYQYSMRIANFWDSRADAILLRQNFAEKSAEKFDDLVQALAPDTYDFRPMPRSLFGLRWPRNP